MKFTLIWMSPGFDVGIDTYEAATMDDAITQWEADTNDCTLIGVLAGHPEILMWDS